MESRVWERKNKKSRLFSLEVHQGSRHGLFPASLCPSFSFLQSASEAFIAPRAAPSLCSAARAAAGPGEGARGGSVPPVCAQSWAEAGGCPCRPLLLSRSGKAGDVEPQPRCPGGSGGSGGIRGIRGDPSVTSRPPGKPRISPSSLVSLPSVSAAGLGGLGGRFWISPLAFPRVPTPAAPGTENPEHLPSDTRLSLDWGHVPALASPQSPAVPQEGTGIGASGCSLLVPIPSSPHLGHGSRITPERN